MLVKLTEVCNKTPTTYRAYADVRYTLREIFVNPAQVIMIRENNHVRGANAQELISEGLSPEHRFSTITINRGQSGSEVVVVGAPDFIEKLIYQDSAQLLKG